MILFMVRQECIRNMQKNYVEQVKKELPDDLNTITGELRSQKTDGWYTLANTASSRIYIKQWNVRCEMLFEKVAEPLAAIAAKEGMEYPQDLFTYGWKLLMQNHPHDSICGCSVDDVHREMVTRFEKAEQVALHIISMCMDYLKGKIDTSAVKEGNIPFVVVNTTGWDRTGVVELELETDRMYFSEAPVAEVAAKRNSRNTVYLTKTEERSRRLSLKLQIILIMTCQKINSASHILQNA